MSTSCWTTVKHETLTVARDNLDKMANQQIFDKIIKIEKLKNK